MIVRLLLAALVAFGLFAASAPEPRDVVSPAAAAALVDDLGDSADATLVASGPLPLGDREDADAPFALAQPVIYQHPLFVFRPPRVATFN